MVLKYTCRPVLWGRHHKGPRMPLCIIQITVALKGSMSSTPFSLGASEARVNVTFFLE